MLGWQFNVSLRTALMVQCTAHNTSGMCLIGLSLSWHAGVQLLLGAHTLVVCRDARDVRRVELQVFQLRVWQVAGAGYAAAPAHGLDQQQCDRRRARLSQRRGPHVRREPGRQHGAADRSHGAAARPARGRVRPRPLPRPLHVPRRVHLLIL